MAGRRLDAHRVLSSDQARGEGIASRMRFFRRLVRWSNPAEQRPGTGGELREFQLHEDQDTRSQFVPGQRAAEMPCMENPAAARPQESHPAFRNERITGLKSR